MPRHNTRFVVVTRVDHGKFGNRAADRDDQERQHRELRPAAAIGVEVGAHRFERGDVHFLDIGEVRDRALRCRHILGDLAAHADDLDRLVGAGAAGARGVIALPAAVAEKCVEIGMANAVAVGMDLPQIDAQILRASTNGG